MTSLNLWFVFAVVKQRMQMCCSPHTKAFECTKYVYQNEGLRAFYRSYWTALSMNIPYQMAMVMSYGLVQRHFNPDGAYNPTIHFLAGAAAGGVAAVVTMPLDVCKTLLNTQESAVLKQLNKVEVRGLRNAARTVYGLRGFRGFFQGLMPRLLYQVGFISYWPNMRNSAFLNVNKLSRFFKSLRDFC